MKNHLEIYQKEVDEKSRIIAKRRFLIFRFVNVILLIFYIVCVISLKEKMMMIVSLIYAIPVILLSRLVKDRVKRETTYMIGVSILMNSAVIALILAGNIHPYLSVYTISFSLILFLHFGEDVWAY